VITREATSADIPEIVRVINLAYRVEDFFINGNRTNAEDIQQRMSHPNASVIVVDAPDSVGLAGAVWMEIDNGRGHFGMLSVDPAHQGKGVAKALIDAVEKKCRDAECIFLDIEVVNLREELPPFYTRLGFTHQGVIPFAPAEKLTRDAHLVLMAKPLT
jgi:GNAT superfamily N-acetyltransferase